MDPDNTSPGMEYGTDSYAAGAAQVDSLFDLGYLQMLNPFSWIDVQQWIPEIDNSNRIDPYKHKMDAYILVYNWLCDFNWTWLNPFKWIDIVYTFLFQWLHDYDFGIWIITKMVLKFLFLLFWMYHSLQPYIKDWTASKKEQTKEENEKRNKEKHKQLMTEIKQDENAKTKEGTRSSKPKSKKVVPLKKNHKKEMLKAKMRLGTPQAGPSGVVTGPGLDHDITCACETCLDQVD